MDYSISRRIRINVKGIDDTPISGAMVQLLYGRKVLRMDETSIRGYITMDQVPGGVYTITVTYNGSIMTSELEIDANSGDLVKLTIMI